MGRIRRPVYSTGDGEVTFVSQSSPPIDPKEAEVENMVKVKNADGFIWTTYLHLLKNSVGVLVGQKIKSGQSLAQMCVEWRLPPPVPPHLHFGIIPDPNDAIGDVTVPGVFSNYEVRQSNGSWTFVSRGIPQTNEVVRCTGPMSSWDHIGHANNVVAMAAINGKLFAATNDKKLWWRDA